MKRIRFFVSLLLVLLSTSVMAQLPNGSVAPDFTATDIDGVEWNLYDLLDAGTTVIIDFYATWCGPCWSYRESGVLDEVWAELGPDGTGEVMIFSMESDDTTNAADLAGTGSATTGDWITGTPFPMFDDCGNIFSLYENGYFPTIYTICPNHILTESGQADAAGHIAVATANFCAAASEPADAILLNYTGETLACFESATALSVQLMNMGTEPLTACTIEMSYGGSVQHSYDWTGNLDTYGMEDVQMGSHDFSAATDFEINVVADGDANTLNNAVMSAMELATPSSSFIYVHILTDNWGEETSWEIVNGNGDVLQSVGGGTLDNNTEYTWEVEVDPEACYTFTISDAYGDGLFGSQWGNSLDGYCRVTSLPSFPGVDFAATPVSIILDYDGTTQFSVLSAGFSTSMGDVIGWTLGCMDPTALNYDFGAEIDDGTCVYEIGCLDIGQAFWAEDFSFGIFPESVYGFVGDVLWHHDENTVVSGFVLNVPTNIVDPNTGAEYGVYSFDVGQISALPDGVDWSSDFPGIIAGGEQVCLETSGHPILEGLYEVEVIGDLNISVFGNPFLLGAFTAVLYMEVLPNPNPVAGCTYFGASNFNPIANSDDGSCEFSGCTDPLGVNYYALFNLDDGSCVYDLEDPCLGDLNSDQLVGISDLLMLLGEFGGVCP